MVAATAMGAAVVGKAIERGVSGEPAPQQLPPHIALAPGARGAPAPGLQRPAAAAWLPPQVDPELVGLPTEEEAASKRTRIKIEDPTADKKAQKPSGSSTG
jgi:hypothetical protein